MQPKIWNIPEIENASNMKLLNSLQANCFDLFLLLTKLNFSTLF